MQYTKVRKSTNKNTTLKVLKCEKRNNSTDFIKESYGYNCKYCESRINDRNPWWNEKKNVKNE